MLHFFNALDLNTGRGMRIRVHDLCRGVGERGLEFMLNTQLVCHQHILLIYKYSVNLCFHFVSATSCGHLKV